MTNESFDAQFSFSQIPDSLEIRDGLPRPNWQVIFDWVNSQLATTDARIVWRCMANNWIAALIEALQAGYWQTKSSNFLLLSNQDERSANRILGYCENARRIIFDTLAGVAQEQGTGKHLVFAFENEETYYDYITDFYPEEGEFASSGGIFISAGLQHFVMPVDYTGELERTIAHELNHALLRHLPLPHWLNEGVTQYMEDRVVGSSNFMIDYEIVQRHRDYWDADLIQSFWSGESFFFPDDGQELSYHLAQILFRNLIADCPDKISDFLLAANYTDAGDSALQQVCEVSLQDRIVQFLGPGEWNPRADYTEQEKSLAGRLLQ